MNDITHGPGFLFTSVVVPRPHISSSLEAQCLVGYLFCFPIFLLSHGSCCVWGGFGGVLGLLFFLFFVIGGCGFFVITCLFVVVLGFFFVFFTFNLFYYCSFSSLFSFFLFFISSSFSSSSKGQSVGQWYDVRMTCDRSSIAFDLVLFYVCIQPELHDWCNKGRGMCYPVCGMMHIKEPLLLIGKSSPCGGSRFPLSLSEWSFTICLTSYNRK